MPYSGNLMRRRRDWKRGSLGHEGIFFKYYASLLNWVMWTIPSGRMARTSKLPPIALIICCNVLTYISVRCSIFETGDWLILSSSARCC